MKHVLLPILLCLTSCAGERAMRSTSSQTAVVLQQYRTAFRDVAAQQSALNVGTEDRISHLTAMANFNKVEIESRKMSWSLAGDHEALDRLALVGAKGPDEILAGMAPTPAAVATPTLKFDPAPVDAVIKQLVVLQKKPDWATSANDLIAYGTALRTAYDAALKDDGDKASAATADTKKATTPAVAPTE
ncbi:MAG: hypothetical protein JWN66_297 [Sphingomonas bacterium]|nr:hypothetical protein [Sphingomonas bacterium]